VLPVAVDHDDFSISQGIYYARHKYAKVISISIGKNDGYSVENSSTIATELSYAWNDSITVVIGSSDKNKYFPDAGNSGAIMVGGMDPDANGAWYNSGWGPRIDVCAAASNVCTAVYNPNGPYTTDTAQQGVSFAVPIVAGAAVLCRKYSINQLQTRDILIYSADNQRNTKADFVTTQTLTDPSGQTQIAYMGRDLNNIQAVNFGNGAQIRSVNAWSACKMAEVANWDFSILLNNSDDDTYVNDKGAITMHAPYKGVSAGWASSPGTITVFTNNGGCPYSQGIVCFKKGRVFYNKIIDVCTVTAGGFDLYQTYNPYDPGTSVGTRDSSIISF